MTDQATQKTDCYFTAMAVFHNPNVAAKASAALAAAGYAFEQVPYDDDEDDVHGTITGHIAAGADEHALCRQLIEIVDTYGTCDNFRFYDQPGPTPSGV